MRPRRLAQVDVFASAPQRGNPVAVVLDGDGLEPAAMQRFARWTAPEGAVWVAGATRTCIEGLATL